MPILSHSAVEFQRRAGLRTEPSSPRPRLDVGDLLMNSLPFGVPGELHLIGAAVYEGRGPGDAIPGVFGDAPGFPTVPEPTVTPQ